MAVTPHAILKWDGSDMEERPGKSLFAPKSEEITGTGDGIPETMEM
jgi:hypothetical protein